MRLTPRKEGPTHHASLLKADCEKGLKLKESIFPTRVVSDKNVPLEYAKFGLVFPGI